MTRSFFFTAGCLIDGIGGPSRRNVLVRVKKGIISSIRDARDDDFAIPGLVDLSMYTVLPAMVDSHVHLFMSGTGDPSVRSAQLNAGFREIKDVIVRHLEQQITHGVAAVRDGGDYAGHALRYKKECLGSAGVPVLVKAAGRAWRAPGRYGRLIGRPPIMGLSLSEAIAREQGDSDHVKIVNSGLNSLTFFGKETPEQFSLGQLKAAVSAARRLGLGTMVHANGRLPVRLAIEAGCHSIEHGFFMGSENLKRMAERQVTWVPTAYTMGAYHLSLPPDSPEREVAKQNLEHQLEQVSIARGYGVPVALGTDSGSLGVHHGASVKGELRLLMRAGFSLEEAVKCATSNGATLLGLQEELGRLCPGMPATFLATKGGGSCLPGALETPEMVFIQGEEWSPAPLPGRK